MSKVFIATFMVLMLSGCNQAYKNFTVSPNSVGYNGVNYNGEVRRVESNIPYRTHVQATVNPASGTIVPTITADMQNTPQGGKVINLYIDEVPPTSY